MSELRRIDLGTPALLEFSGPDAIRFLNGQMTQDVRTVMDRPIALPSCITDAKGKLQFRVWIHAHDGAVRVEGPEGAAEAIEARLTRYLIADEVEVADLSGQWQLHHLTGVGGQIPSSASGRESMRYGRAGIDCWLPAGVGLAELAGIPLLEGDALESFRIGQGVPAWGKELVEGMLPPEAGLDVSDISYHKGCYIGQEVISRIKSAGKVNKKLTRLSWDASLPSEGIKLVDPDGKPAGEITSIAPLAENRRHALGFLKRGIDSPCLETPDGARHPIA